MTQSSISRASISAAGTSLEASLLAGAIIGWAVTVQIGFDPRYLAGCIVVAGPVGLGLAGLAAVRPPAGMLALIELLGAAALLLAQSAGTLVSDVPLTALLATFVVGVVAVAYGRARAGDLLVAIIAGNLCAALIYEVGVPLHSVL